MTGGNLDQDDPDAVGVLDPHLDLALWLRYWLPYDRDSGGGQPGVLGVNVADLEPEAPAVSGGSVPASYDAGRVPCSPVPSRAAVAASAGR